VLAVVVQGKLADVVVLVKRFFYQVVLFILGDDVKNLLERVCAFSMTRNVNEGVAFQLLQKFDSLMNLHAVEELLQEVVAVVVFN
jgi:uncharacterized protein YlbG (UPF0298 family)